MKLSSHALRSLQELDETGRQAVERIVQDHIRACLLNGFQPENLERVYQEAIEIIRLEGLGPDFSGNYRVKSATHSIDGSGYRTNFQVFKETIP